MVRVEVEHLIRFLFEIKTIVVYFMFFSVKIHSIIRYNWLNLEGYTTF